MAGYKTEQSTIWGSNGLISHLKRAFLLFFQMFGSYSILFHPSG